MYCILGHLVSITNSEGCQVVVAAGVQASEGGDSRVGHVELRGHWAAGDCAAGCECHHLPVAPVLQLQVAENHGLPVGARAPVVMVTI